LQKLKIDGRGFQEVRMFKYLSTFNDRKKLNKGRNQDALLMTTDVVIVYNIS
jgi:hypothetical protein